MMPNQNYTTFLKFLQDSGIPSPERELRWIAAYLLKIDSPKVKPADYDKIPRQIIENVLKRRAGGEPLSRITREREFYGINFMISPETLDPRPDSEVLVERALYVLPPRALILDLGTGSGCLLLSILAHAPQAQGVGVDISENALHTAQDNADRLGLSPRVQFIQSDWFSNVAGRYDVIISNPPYIPSAEIKSLDRVVQEYDPHRALDGGEDGLYAYRAIAKSAKNHLSPRGQIIVEIGFGQSPDVGAIFNTQGFTCQGIGKDLNKIDRVMVFSRSEQEVL